MGERKERVSVKESITPGQGEVSSPAIRAGNGLGTVGTICVSWDSISQCLLSECQFASNIPCSEAMPNMA